ncbi:MAG: phage integrase N-terminal SAM-like domain-containing protein [Planctomycetes bacterium]|nr:phage integrase N-terminal SAM-like domain-containing protein [Planctomycetota bacterium]
MRSYDKEAVYIQKLIDDMTIRNLSQRTIEGYVFAIRRLAKSFGKSPTTLTLNEVRTYLKDMIANSNYAFNTYKQNVCAMRYFYRHIAVKKWSIENIPYPKREIQASVILSRDEVMRLLEAIDCPKVKLLAVVAYATGLRHFELRNLTVYDIDSERMKIIVRKGKGKKSREVQLPPSIHQRLIKYYKNYRNKIKPYFFLELNQGSPLMKHMPLEELRLLPKEQRFARQ